MSIVSGKEINTNLTNEVALKIIDYIERNHLKRGDHLAAQRFADAFRVSRSPVRKALIKLSSLNVFETGAAFHELLMRSSGNPFYLEALKRQNRLRRLIVHKGAIDAERLVRQCREHLRILDLLEAGENARAAEIMRAHLSVASEAATRTCRTSRAAAPVGELHL